MKLILLDRDGVINHDSENYIKSVDEWIPIDGSLEAIAKLSQNGFRIAVVTNQSGIARNFYSVETLHAMHDKLRRLLRPLGGQIQALFYCPHGPNDDCQCRKPKDGLYKNVQTLFNTSLNGVITVGDSFRDLEAAMQVGSSPVLIKTGKGISTFQNKQKEIESLHIPVYDNLAEFVEELIN